MKAKRYAFFVCFFLWKRGRATVRPCDPWLEWPLIITELKSNYSVSKKQNISPKAGDYFKKCNNYSYWLNLNNFYIFLLYFSYFLRNFSLHLCQRVQTSPFFGAVGAPTLGNKMWTLRQTISTRHSHIASRLHLKDSRLNPLHTEMFSSWANIR